MSGDVCCAGGHFVFVFAARDGASIKTKNKQRQHQRFILKTTTAIVHGEKQV